MPKKAIQIDDGSQFSLTEPTSAGLELLDGFQRFQPEPNSAGDSVASSDTPTGKHRFVARLSEFVALKPGDTTLSLDYRIPTADAKDQKQSAEGTLAVVVHTPAAKQAVADATKGVALIGGSLELQLGHLCDQARCVEHFHKSLAEIPSFAAVHPHPSLKDPRATVYLRAATPVNIWKIRETLRHQSIEPSGMVPRGMHSYRMRIELPRWQEDEKSNDAVQCVECRNRAEQAMKELSWIDQVQQAGGGINFRVTQTDVDLIELIDVLARIETTPLAVWLLPTGVSMPKAAPPQLAVQVDAKHGGSNVHPIVEFHFGHTCDVGTHALSVLSKRNWTSRTHSEWKGDTAIVRAAIGDRKFANLTQLIDEFRSAGHVPTQLRLAEFGDIRIQLEFANICGEIEYSKPPKKKEKKKEPNKKAKTDETPSKPAESKTAKKENSKSTTDNDSDQQAKDKAVADQKAAGNETTECCQAPSETKSKPKQEAKKPFVPKPLRPAKSSHGRQAIEAAIARVTWVKQANFYDYHTKPEFTGPRKIMLSLQANGNDVVQLDDLIQSLRDVGFPPKSMIVSRRFPGIPFGKQLPSDLLVTDRQGQRISLSSMQKQGQPLAVAFVSLQCPRHKKYKANPTLYERMAGTIEKYNDRVQFVAVSANNEDKFADVDKFWERAGLSVPLMHDAAGQARAVFNSQVTPPPHLFVFDADLRLRYAGDPHDHWEKPDKQQDDFLARALDLVLAGTYQSNGAVFYKASVCNCADPNCKCPKCGCGPTCRCTIKH